VTKVFAARTPTEAHLVKTLLESEGIAAEVQGDWLFSTIELVTPETWPSVWVIDDSQLQQAIKLVEDYETKTGTE
jgi:hypothetical protein